VKHKSLVFEEAVRSRLTTYGKTLADLSRHLNYTRASISAGIVGGGNVRLKLRVAYALGLPLQSAIDAAGDCFAKPMAGKGKGR